MTGTDGDDTITAANTATASTTGLDVTDVIDGGAGTADTLVLTLGAAFAGFTDSVGSMTGVEIVSLSNDSAVSRTFDASNVTGVTTYNVDATNGAIVINDAQTVATLNLSNQASGTMTLTMDVTGDNATTGDGTDGGTVATNVAGTADTLAFNVTAVGTANTAAATLASNASAVSLATTGYETIAVTSSGTAQNLVNLSTAVGATTITATGTADLVIADVAAATTTINAADMAGDLDLTTTSATTSALVSITGGAGDDTFNVIATDLSATAVINGGAGADILSLVGTGLTMAPTITLVETIDITQVTGTSTISLLNSAASAAGLTIRLDNPTNATETFAGTMTLANDVGATTFDINGAHAGTITTTATGAIGIDIDPASGATAAQVVTTVINADSASSVTLDVARFGSFTGTISADTAETVSVTATRVAMAGDIDAAAATTFTLDSNGAAMNLATNAAAGFAGATTVVASGATVAGTNGSMTLGDIGASTMTTSATTITVSELAGGFVADDVDAGAGSLTIDTTAALGTSTFAATTGIEAAGALILNHAGSLGNLTVTGTTNTSDGALTVTGTNAVGNITLTGTVSADNAIIFNLEGMLGTFATNNITDAGTLTINAATYQGTAITGDTYVVETAATLNMGQAGTHIITHAADEDILTVTLNTGAGTDNVTVNHAALTDTLTVTGSMGTAAATDVLIIGTNTVTSTVTTSGLTNADGGVTFDMGATGGAYVGGAAVDTVTDNAAITTAASISTGAGNDAITLNAVNTATVTITGGTGADVITLTGATGVQDITLAAGDSGVTTATADVVVTFETANDTFSLGTAGVAGAGGNYIFLDADVNAGADDIATVELAVAAANAATGAGTSFDGTVRYMHVGDTGTGADGYLVADMNLDGVADLAVDLTGGALAAFLVATDIVA